MATHATPSLGRVPIQEVVHRCLSTQEAVWMRRLVDRSTLTLGPREAVPRTVYNNSSGACALVCAYLPMTDPSFAWLPPSRRAYDSLFLEIAEKGVTDISELGRWQLSTWRPGFGLKQLLDNTPTAYWQSDGDLPHSVEIQFSKFVEVSMVTLFVDFREDESYTPSRVRILAGFGRNDLVEVDEFNIEKIDGWSCLALGSPPTPQQPRTPIKCMFLKIEVNQNYQNGKDTHVRGLRILGAYHEEPSPNSTNFSPIGMRV